MLHRIRFTQRSLGARARASIIVGMVALAALIQAIPARAVNDPQLESTSPANGATVSSANATLITATFDRTLQNPQAGDFIVRSHGGAGSAIASASITRSPGSLGEGDTLIFQPTGPLPEAGNDYVGTVKARPAPSGDVTTITFSFSIDDTAPDMPTVDAPQDGDLVGGKPVQVTGSAEPGTTVKVLEGASELGSGTAAGDGSFDVSILDVDEDNIPHAITVQAVDAANNASDATAPIAFTHDSVAPAAPAITSPADDTHTSSADVSLSGTGTGDILIFDGATQIGVVEDTTGSWNHTATGLSEGTHAFTAKARDEALNTSDASNEVTVVVDQTAPAMPTVDIDPKPINASSDDATTVLGSAEPNADVEIVVTDVNLDMVQATTAADGDGVYAQALDLSPLADGFLNIEVTATDAADNSASASITVSKDTQVARPSVDFTPEVITQANVTAVELTGAGEAGSNLDVQFFRIGSGNPVMANTTIVEDGTFALTTDLSGLGDGTIVAATILTDPSGNSITSDCNQPQPNGCDQVSKDTTGPSAVSLSITSPAEDATVSTAAVDVEGTAEANASVTLSEGEVELGAGVADANGDWAITTSDLSGDGEHTITALQSDEHGNPGTGSVTRTIVLDLDAPSVVETSPADDLAGDNPVSNVTAVSATYSEELSAGTLSVEDKDGILVSGSSAVAGDTVTWTSGFGALPEVSGPYTATTTGEDAGGSQSEPYSFTFHVDNTAPDAPAITAPADGTVLKVSTFDVVGTAEAGSDINLYDGDTPLADGLADGNGDWTINVTVGDGEHMFIATSTDGAGNLGDASAPVNVSVDTAAPIAPEIVTPLEGALVNTKTVTIGGLSEAEADIEVRWTGHGIIENTTADADGVWSVDHTFPDDGAIQVKARATDGAGNTGPFALRNFTIDSTAPDAPVIVEPAEGETLYSQEVVLSGTAAAGSMVEVFEGETSLGSIEATDGTWSLTHDFGADGPYTVSATATDAAQNSSSSAERSFTINTTPPVAPAITSPAQNATLASSSVQILGTAEADATITVREGETEIGTTTANMLGNWSLDATFGNGSHTITATATNAGGLESDASVARTFTVDIEAPEAPTIVKPAEGATLTNKTVTISGSTEPNASVSVREDGVQIATATAGPGGAWSTTAVFTDGSHSITATATDGAGNAGSESDARTFTVAHDATAPDAPVILTPEEGSEHGAQVTVSGTAEPLSIVAIRENGSTIANPSTNAAGQWSIARSFSSGDHTITAVASDANGNVSEASEPRAFNVDGTRPSVTYSTGDGEIFLPGTPVTLAGSASDNRGVAAVTIVIRDVRGTKVGEVEATLATPGATETTWDVTLEGLAPGRYVAVANATDSTNLKSPAASISFVTLAVL